MRNSSNPDDTLRSIASKALTKQDQINMTISMRQMLRNREREVELLRNQLRDKDLETEKMRIQNDKERDI